MKAGASAPGFSEFTRAVARSPRTALAELEARLRRAQAPILAGLRPGLSAAEVARQFAEAHLEPGADLRALYAWHDGAAGGGPAAELMATARFLSLQEAMETRRFELGTAAENEFLPDVPAVDIFDPRWFPILDDPVGRVYVVEELGAGRVMIVDRMQVGAHEVLGESFVAFVDSLAHDGIDFKPPPPSADVAVLVARLESKNDRERVRAGQELTRKRPAAAFEPLVAMLESSDPSARQTAALILGLLGDRRAIPILIRCIARWSTRDSMGRSDATSAWAGLRDVSKEDVLTHLERALAEGDTALRLDAITSIVFSRDARAAVALQAAAMSDADPAVRAAAEQALRAVGEPL